MSSEAGRDFVVVCYDIVDDDQRCRVAEALEGYGTRVQFSVFELFADSRTLSSLRHRLGELIDPLTDRIRIYRFCGRDALDRRRTGKGPVVANLAYGVF